MPEPRSGHLSIAPWRLECRSRVAVTCLITAMSGGIGDRYAAPAFQSPPCYREVTATRSAGLLTQPRWIRLIKTISKLPTVTVTPN